MNPTKALLLSLLVFGGLAPVYSAPTVTIQKQDPSMPEIWKKVPVAQRLQYVRAAELDGTRILAERIMGISLDGESTVRELAAADDSIKGQLAATLKGVKTVGNPVYHDDGRVEVIRAVKVDNLVKCVTSSPNFKRNGTTYKHVKQDLDAIGNSAIPSSLGYKRIRAKRAAEMDVYRRLAERIAGVQITSESTVRDFAVQSDTIKSRFAHLLKSAEITAITYIEDGTAQVTANVKIGPLVRTIEREISAKGKVLSVKETVSQAKIEETGSGASEAAPATKEAAQTSEPSYKEVDVILEDIL